MIIESDNGAKASTILYSLVETAKANRLNIYKYFELLLTEIPKHMGDKDLSFISNLMPWSPRVQEKCPSLYKKIKISKEQKISKMSDLCRNAGIFHYMVLMFEDLQNIHQILVKPHIY